jgi:hypothetical protein
MSELLAVAVDAHGGLDRWQQLTGITARLSCGGQLWAAKGWSGALDDFAATIDPHHQHSSLAPFTEPDRRSVFTPDRVAIATAAGELIAQRQDPRAAFSGHGPQTPWDALHLAYFTGYAIWTYLTVPFCLTQPGFAARELQPWQEDGQTWRRLQARFPARIAAHSPDQVLYFGPDGLLRRHYYTADLLGGAPIAHYTHQHTVYGGISFPTQRRAVTRQPDGASVPEPVLVSIDIAAVTLHSTVPDTGRR